jgi:hypothetical protein
MVAGPDEETAGTADRAGMTDKEIKAPILIKISLVAHGPRLMDAFFKLTITCAERLPISRRRWFVRADGPQLSRGLGNLGYG